MSLGTFLDISIWEYFKMTLKTTTQAFYNSPVLIYIYSFMGVFHYYLYVDCFHICVLILDLFSRCQDHMSQWFLNVSPPESSLVLKLNLPMILAFSLSTNTLLCISTQGTLNHCSTALLLWATSFHASTYILPFAYTTLIPTSQLPLHLPKWF